MANITNPVRAEYLVCLNPWTTPYWAIQRDPATRVIGEMWMFRHLIGYPAANRVRPPHFGQNCALPNLTVATNSDSMVCKVKSRLSHLIAMFTSTVDGHPEGIDNFWKLIQLA
jgi:hypothetical protein